MGTRAHAFFVLTTVSLTSVTSSGCFFFGGGDKKAGKVAQAAAAAAPRMSPSEVAIAGGAQMPPAAAPIDPQAVAARHARDRAVAEVLAPKDSAVAWPKAEELWISAQQPAARQVQPKPEPAPATAAAQDAAQQAPPDAPAYAAPQPPRPAAALSTNADETPVAPVSTDAVANAELALNDADTAPEPIPAAAADARPALVQPVSKQPPQSSGTTTQGDELSRRIAQRLRENPSDVSAHLDHQLLRFLAEDSVPDLNALSTLPAEDRELLTAIVDGLVNFRNGVRADQNMLLSRKARPMIELAARLRSQAELSIPTVALCRRVENFGNYEPMDGRFVAGAKNATIVYCEVGNVSSQQNEQGVWESKLSQEVVLYTETGIPVWTSPRTVVPDRARNRRHDFFVGQKIVLPANLSIARYILKVTVTDEQVKRVAEATVPITMVAALDPQQPPADSPAQPPAPGVAGPAQQAPVRTTDDARTAADRQAPTEQGGGVTSAAGEALNGK